ncbi:nucleoside permease [Candidatus Symbiothrix dinenymphae]|uniref:nucleoside permease n=1 Tax=Candidatus Symbiothrix dinenymphae TaxID=467085 RepID=UPI0006C29F8C|nr:nucleoside permease [Candidatus Symbiothrix dinenymphae]GAP73334.1 nucleoside permease NupG [Candidatus Symbiothrix dinenymphae]
MLKLRLIIAQFLQFFIWGSWLISFGGYLYSIGTAPMDIAAVYALAGFASLITPGIIGIIADKWLNSERLYGICHLIGAVALFFAAQTIAYGQLFPLMAVYLAVFMPTISLSYSLSYSLLHKSGFDTDKTFPPIRSWGTIGFIVAMWAVNLLDWTFSANQLLLAAGASALLGLYAFTLPVSPPMRSKGTLAWKSAFGIDALALFKQRQMRIFFLFAVLIGVCLQITNAWGTPFLEHFRAGYPDSFTVKYPLLISSISQISEALFILAIPFVLRKYGIKTIMLMSIGAWALRFGFFGVGDAGTGFVWLLLSMVVYGMAFDFFNIAGSLFIEREAPEPIRASAQGLWMMASMGVGAVVGQFAAASVVGFFTVDGVQAWSAIWLTFTAYAAVVGVLFALFFHPQNSRRNGNKN